MSIAFRRFFLPNRPLLKVIIAFRVVDETRIEVAGVTVPRTWLEKAAVEHGTSIVRPLYRVIYDRLRAQIERGDVIVVRDARQAFDIDALGGVSNADVEKATGAHANVDDPMNGHEESEACFCAPRIEEHDGARLVIHNRVDN